MLFPSFTSMRWQKVFKLVIFALLVGAFIESPAQAQMGGIDSDPGNPGTGGKNTIQGNIFYPDGRRLDRRAKVRLRSIMSGDLFIMTDDNGAFTFRRLRG